MWEAHHKPLEPEPPCTHCGKEHIHRGTAVDRQTAVSLECRNRFTGLRAESAICGSGGITKLT